jgi:hypothetical protein
MNLESFKFKLAGACAEKTGITPKHARIIIHHALNLPSRPIQKTVEIATFGKVVLINRKVRRRPYAVALRSSDPSYETVVNFDVGKTSKTFTFPKVQVPKRGLPRQYAKYFHEILMGGLEGNPDTDRTRPPRKYPDKLAASLEGGHDTDRTRTRGKIL